MIHTYDAAQDIKTLVIFFPAVFAKLNQIFMYIWNEGQAKCTNSALRKLNNRIEFLCMLCFTVLIMLKPKLRKIISTKGIYLRN